MDTLYFKGNREQQREPAKLPVSRRHQFLHPENYYPDQGLIDAVNVALTLGQPLLLTGDPGTGKTQLATYLAWELNLGEVLKFETKSTSTAQDLFYTYDTLRHFHDIQTKRAQDTRAYITIRALGEAILATKPVEQYRRYIPLTDEEAAAYTPKRSVVLLDEIDKAPRDFPNDILNEIDRLFFRVPELGGERIDAAPQLQPIIVLTSNSEKDLPDAFLRRCVFYYIPFPEDKAAMQRIVAGRLGTMTGGTNAFYDDALGLFQELRKKHHRFRKMPATAELLDWLSVMLHQSGDADNPLAESPDLALKSLGSLIKTTEDLAKARKVVKDWFANRQTA